MPLRVVTVALAVVCVGCVATARSRPSSSEAQAGPPPPPASERSAGELVAKTPKGAVHEEEPDPHARPGHVWVRGYWHWNAVRWVWVRGRWEKKHPVWARKP